MLSNRLLPVMAPTVKRIMTQPIVSLKLERLNALSFSFSLVVVVVDDGDLFLTISFFLIHPSPPPPHTHALPELDLPLLAVEADGPDMAVRAGRFEDRRADYRELDVLFLLFSLDRRGGGSNLFFLSLDFLSLDFLSRGLSSSTPLPPCRSRNDDGAKTKLLKNFLCRASTST